MTALYELTLGDGFSRDDVLGTVRLRWTEPGATRNRRSKARDRGDRPWRSASEAADPAFRLDAIVAARPEILHRDGRSEGPVLRDVLDTSPGEAGDLPATDQVHDFLALLERLAGLRD